MDIQHIQTVVDLIASSQVAEVSIQSTDGSIRVKNSPHAMGMHQHPDTPMEIASAQMPVTVSSSETATAVSHDHLVKSTHIGRLKLSADAASQPVINVGDSVAVGDTVAYVISLARMLPVVSDKAGVVAEILLTNDSKVEYGTPILRLQ